MFSQLTQYPSELDIQIDDTAMDIKPIHNNEDFEKPPYPAWTKLIASDPWSESGIFGHHQVGLQSVWKQNDKSGKRIRRWRSPNRKKINPDQIEVLRDGKRAPWVKNLVL